jgi:hypothetical protein
VIYTRMMSLTEGIQTDNRTVSDCQIVIAIGGIVFDRLKIFEGISQMIRK